MYMLADQASSPETQFEMRRSDYTHIMHTALTAFGGDYVLYTQTLMEELRKRNFSPKGMDDRTDRRNLQNYEAWFFLTSNGQGLKRGECPFVDVDPKLGETLKETVLRLISQKEEKNQLIYNEVVL